MISEENWQYAQYIQGEMRAYISVEYSPELEETYLINTEKNDQPYSQMKFPELTSACLAINAKYDKWRHIELPSFQEETKCSTCH